MTQEKWQQIVGMVKDQFVVENYGSETLEDMPNASVEFIVFVGPLGKTRLEYTTRPVVLDKKALGSKRIGSETSVQYTYSDTEFSNTFKAYQWSDTEDNWVEMEREAVGAFSV